MLVFHADDKMVMIWHQNIAMKVYPIIFNTKGEAIHYDSCTSRIMKKRIPVQNRVCDEEKSNILEIPGKGSYELTLLILKMHHLLLARWG